LDDHALQRVPFRLRLDDADDFPVRVEEVVHFGEAPLVRNADTKSANEAAQKIAPQLGSIQRQVIQAYRDIGDMTSKAAEALPRFARYGRSTIQKRISELLGVGVLEYVDDSPEATYRLVEARVLNPLPRVRVERCPVCQQPVTQTPDRQEDAAAVQAEILDEDTERDDDGR
jgi:hypothetical protein